VGAEFYRPLIKILREKGCHYVRPGKGSHEIWYSPISKRTFTVPRAKRSATANDVLKDAGLPKAF
jgi:predicted RNA binding protein YcfA (HicA-like mRNA interferase family)